jgi:ATP-dependent exoDNAse (exonuclease V) beta subunit
MRANEIGGKTDDEVLLQGKIDLLYFDGAEAVVVDYKYSGKSAAELKNTYAAQLALYRTAAERILGVRVKSTLLFNIRDASVTEV